MLLILLLSPYIIFCKKESFKGSNHFKIHILESLIDSFYRFALDGVELYKLKVEGRNKNKNEVHLEKDIFEKCSQLLFGFLGI
jgi:hypothetical protein